MSMELVSDWIYDRNRPELLLMIGTTTAQRKTQSIATRLTSGWAKSYLYSESDA